jgi:hypothetical protein
MLTFKLPDMAKKEKLMRKAIIALFVVVMGYPAAANATPLVWMLENATFVGGGSASGSFTYDATTNQFSNIDISTTATGAYTAQVFTFKNCCSDILFDTFASNPADLTGVHFLQIQFANPLSNAGGTDPFAGFNDYQGVCANASCSSNASSVSFASGSATTTLTPEPASFSLISLGLLAIAAWRRAFLARSGLADHRKVYGRTASAKLVASSSAK